MRTYLRSFWRSSKATSGRLMVMMGAIEYLWLIEISTNAY